MQRKLPAAALAGLMTIGFLATPATATTTAEPAGPPAQPGAECSAADFRDNEPGNHYYDFIRWMQCSDLAEGFADNSFGTFTDITRGESLSLVHRYLQPKVEPTATFPDVPETNAHFDAISWGVAEEITTGYVDGEFKPDRNVTRGEFASFLYRALDPEVENPHLSFTDVPKTNAHHDSITWMASEGLSVGYQDNSFRPSQPITRGEVAALMFRYNESQLATEEPEMPAGEPVLLTDPFLQVPEVGQTNVAWFTELEGSQHWVITGDVYGLTAEDLMPTVDKASNARNGVFQSEANNTQFTVTKAESMQMSRTAEDADSVLSDAPAEEDGIVSRDIFRHEATVTGLEDAGEVDYRVVSILDGEPVLSDTFSLEDAKTAEEDANILLTSDHQAKNNTPANLEWAETVIGDIDAVFMAGDLANVPDRASEWFDSENGLAFFRGLQGNAGFEAPNGETYDGGEILQYAPLYTAIGNHEVQGRVDGMNSLDESFNSPVPREVAEAEYEKVAVEVNPDGHAEVKEQWIEDNSFSTTTYEELFTLPESESGGETYYATTVGNTRLISLYSTRIWRSGTAESDPAARQAASRFQEAADTLDDPMSQGHGSFIFETLAVDSDQYRWLQDELASDATTEAENVVVMMHEGPQGLGDNVTPAFAEPTKIEEKDAEGNVTGIRYEYEAENNKLLTDLTPLIDAEGTSVDLVFNGHSHLWNRFESENGVNYLETSNVGNSYGAYHELSGDSRPVPGAPWNADNYVEQGSPGGLEPIVPSERPFASLVDPDQDAPYVASNDYSIFTNLDAQAGSVTSFILDTNNPDAQPEVLDVFMLD
ncbi:S-layer homology domain-containing protein [Citricoccus sp. K5]|uniref:S-layer homology domain-containing protein n=1 Tax=Citricoccus sp. K5 TaxID=2653135 RepID=UPI0012F29078|nr:S-layer homology domain-containing protein [Citricoccus sp. K5]VXB92216.1 S-layer family protein [Citricoccus sp. K5]